MGFPTARQNKPIDGRDAIVARDRARLLSPVPALETKYGIV